MLTLFTTAKPFKGHIAVIQRNALRSWKLLHPEAEIIVFGDDEGSVEVCAEFGFRHEPSVGRTEFGSIRLDNMFSKAQAVARHEIVCYVNCDIILTEDFPRALQQVMAAHPQFLMVGRRWDTDISESIDFSRSNWATETRRKALATNRPQTDWWIDYFAFSRGLYGPDVPAFAVGRTIWDDWLIWKVIDSEKPVVDASPVVIAIHQNHDYSHHAQGKQGVWKGEEAKRNLQLSGGYDHLRNIADATEILGPEGLRRNTRRHWMAMKRAAALARRFLVYEVWLPVWHFILGISRPLRRALGLRAAAVRRSRGKV